ncbi:hypothetical protein DFP72DRAFT_1011129 [Ephemerocybe angulata]|uniref:Uncharacterized protein n=1 Tax=Ephemerocybe angulata TaxID=980116 RepID=A0A8H6M2G2_9AGAR|nr:hypothetical protein DFP72DRAFT_1011129 [Tulosesus angulatus]
MVVSRRNPAPAVASRTNSAQAIPRKQKHAPSPLTGDEPAPTPESPKKPLKTSKKSRTKKTKTPRTLGLLDRAFLLSLFAFIVYAATACTSASRAAVPLAEQPAICRALSTYRTSVLEPYFIPPLKAAYTHTLGRPDVQAHIQPHLSQLRTHIQPVKDVVERVNERAVRPVVRVVWGVGWKGYVRPWYRRAVLPRYRMYVAPRVQKGWEQGVVAPLQPYVRILKAKSKDAQAYLHEYGIHRAKAWYASNLEPSYRSLKPRVHAIYANARPTVLATYEKVKPVLLQVYARARAAAQAAWVRGRPYACQAWTRARVYAGVAVEEGGKARRTYVDPHVRRILEQVSGEGSSSSATSVRAEATGGVPEDVDGLGEGESTVAAVAEEPTPVEGEVPVVEVPVTTTEPVVEEDLEDVVPPSAKPEEEAPIVTATPSPSPSPEPEAVPVQENVAEKIANTFADRIEKLKALKAEAEAKVAQEAVTTSSTTTTTTTTATPSTTTVIPETEPATKEISTDDFDDFLSDLGIDPLDDVPSPSPSQFPATQEPILDEQAPADPVPAAEAAKEPSEEEVLERKGDETARKRAGILKRHHEWQRQLDELVEEQKGVVVRDVDGVRAAAVSELGEEYESPATKRILDDNEEGRYRRVERGEGEGEKEGLGRRAMGGLERAGAKLVRGLETYVAKAEGRASGWKNKVGGSEEKENSEKENLEKEKEGEREKEVRKVKAGKERERWEEVVRKVEERFGGMVEGVKKEVHEWYKGVRGREHEVAMEASAALKNLAERAQTDIAMDYAWLDDVTYGDWQKYHDLMRTYENFEQEAAQRVHNSSNPTPASSPETTEGADEQTETQTMIQQPASSSASPEWPEFTVPDPLVAALDKLQTEMDEIVAGFGFALSSLKSKAREVFSVYNFDSEEEGEREERESEGFFSVKRERGELVDDMRGMPGYDSGAPGVLEERRERGDISIGFVPGDEKETRYGIGEDGRVVEEGDVRTLLVGKDAGVVRENLRAVGEL